MHIKLKKKTLTLIILLFVLGLLSLTIIGYNYFPLKFVDSNLEKALIDSPLNANRDHKITLNEMRRYRGTLDLSHYFIKDMKGIERCININGLILNNNLIEDFSYINQLEQIHLLYLSNNPINTYEGLADLINLSILDLSSNRIKELPEILTDLPLRELYLRFNDLSDVMLLSEIETLEKLDLSFNKIEDITILSNLKNLKQLYIVNNYPYNEETLDLFNYLDTFYYGVD